MQGEVGDELTPCLGWRVQSGAATDETPAGTLTFTAGCVLSLSQPAADEGALSADSLRQVRGSFRTLTLPQARGGRYGASHYSQCMLTGPLCLYRQAAVTASFQLSQFLCYVGNDHSGGDRTSHLLHYHSALASAAAYGTNTLPPGV